MLHNFPNIINCKCISCIKLKLWNILGTCKESSYTHFTKWTISSIFIHTYNLDFSTYGYTFWIYTLCMASFDLKILWQSGAVEGASKAFGLSNTWPELSPFFNNNYAGPTLMHSLCFLDTWLIDWCKGINKMSYSLFGRIEGLHKELWNFEGGMLGPLQVVVIGAFGCPPGLKFKYAE